MNRHFNRRTLLRGTGVALGLPWLESLAPKVARAAASAPKRFLPIFFPNGSAEYFRPAAVGVGGAWQLSPILAPFKDLKSKLTVLTGMENYSCFQPDSQSVEPSHGRQPGAFLTCVDGNIVKEELEVDEANGTSVDQVIAQHASMAGLTPLRSMQVGLSTWYSYCDGRPCSYSRSISWESPTKPLYKDVDPMTVFNQITGVATPIGDPSDDLEAQKRMALNKSVLDAVLENAHRTRNKLGSVDQKSFDEFLDSVRTVEQRATGVSQGMGGVACDPLQAPTLAATPDAFQDNTETYDKGDHADVMNDLIVMAFQCDVTRVISYMLEDERSEFVYSHVPKRTFTNEGSTPRDDGSTCGNYHGAQHASPTDDGFATINWWQSTKVAELCAKLDAIEEADGLSVLDNSIVLYAGCMHGGNHWCDDLPVALIGGAGGVLRTDQHIEFGFFPNDRPMRDLYYTIMNEYFALGVSDFGVNTKGIAPTLISELLA
jgi:hypothetical protein